MVTLLNTPPEWEIKTSSWQEGTITFGLQNDDEVSIRYSEPNQPPHGGFPYGITVSLVIPKDNSRNLSVDEWAKNTLSISFEGTPPVDKVPAVSKIITINGIESLKVTSVFNGQNNNVFIPYNDKMYIVRSNIFSDNNLSLYEGLFDQILSSFTFLDKEEAPIHGTGAIRSVEKLQNQFCKDNNSGLTISYSEAIEIAQKNKCGLGWQGKEIVVYTENYLCNENTGTWWVDIFTKPEREGCNPACVVNIVNKTAEINWRCTGVIPH